jgi:uncharacterized membrane protein YphA (DoxX/SURF4 family)
VSLWGSLASCGRLAIGLGLGRRPNSGVTNPAQDAILPHPENALVLVRNKFVSGVVQQHVFEQAGAGASRNPLSDWILRGAIALVFVYEGIEKFGAASSWIGLFREIGFGEWFRNFAGVVEVAGGVLVLIPMTVTAGLALLVCTMASAALILAFVVGRPQDSVFSGAFFIGLVFFWWARRS